MIYNDKEFGSIYLVYFSYFLLDVYQVLNLLECHPNFPKMRDMASIFIVCYHHHLGLVLTLSLQNKTRSVDESQDSSFVLLEGEVWTTSFADVTFVALFLYCENSHHLPVCYWG